jgi:CO/xanthine dehydrogenase Mo-binding subunit
VVASYGNGYLDLWLPNAGHHVRAKALSHLLKLPLNKVRVWRINLGGHFGSRSKVSPGDVVTSLLASAKSRRKATAGISFPRSLGEPLRARLPIP